MIEEIVAEDAYASDYPFSQAIRHGDTVYLSGSVPREAGTQAIVDGGIEAQTEKVFENVEAILEAAGTSLDNVIRVTVFLTDMDDFEPFNDVYESKFEKPYPARSAVEVSDLAKEYDVEMEVTAAV